jgi:hypothetical protein
MGGLFRPDHRKKLRMIELIDASIQIDEDCFEGEFNAISWPK